MGTIPVGRQELSSERRNIVKVEQSTIAETDYAFFNGLVEE